jgi:hypothetical protein
MQQGKELTRLSKIVPANKTASTGRAPFIAALGSIITMKEILIGKISRKI